MIMAESIIRDTALSKELKTIPVSAIKQGMIIHAIANQTGSLGVKHKGEVKHLEIISHLRKKGVKTVVVEEPEHSFIVQTVKSSGLLKGFFKKLTFTQPVVELVKDNLPMSLLSAEFADASNIIQQSERIFHKLAKDIETNKFIELRPVSDLAVNIYNCQSKYPHALLSLSMIMDSNKYLANHAIHSAILMCNFAKHIGMSKTDCEKLALLGYVFDLGMLKVNNHILSKKNPLALDEQKAVKRHVEHTLNLMAPLKLDSEFLLAIEQHHERLDGSGYPAGIKSANIHKYSRMLAIVDAYDAMTSQRPFQMPIAPKQAMQRLCGSGSGFDPKLAMQFIKSIGPFPAGSLVVLSCNKVGLVTHVNKHIPDYPKVKLFYDVKGAHFIEPKEIDLAKINNLAAAERKVSIVRPVLASEYGITREHLFDLN